MRLFDMIKIIIFGLYIILVILVIYQVIKAIIGGTWSVENILIAGIGIIFGGMFVIVGFIINQSIILGRLEERTQNIGKSINNLGNDFKEHLSNHR